MKRTLFAILALALMPFATGAQQTAQAEANPVSNTVRSILDKSSTYMLAAADEMPADKYSFHPTPAQMSFGHLVTHMISSNYFLCSKISGMAAPAGDKPGETDPKDKLVGQLKASFDYCTQALSKVDDSNLGEQIVTRGDHKVSRAGLMIALTNDFADHYSMAATYLRLNGLLPPTAQEQHK
jgi:hypothetical protein